MKVIDLTGRKFGRLIVIKRSYPNKSGQAMWLCRCGCGVETIVYGSTLRSGNTKSCGCLQRELTSHRSDRWRLKPGIAPMRELIGNYKRKAKKRGLEYSLTEKQFAEITKQDCHYCGAKPNTTFDRRRNNGTYTYNGLDRVDNNRGYTIGNVVPCCSMCNTAKSNHSLQEFKDWIEKVYDKTVGE